MSKKGGRNSVLYCFVEIKKKYYICKNKSEKDMATAIKAIPTLKGKEAQNFLRRAEENERKRKNVINNNEHPYCQFALKILGKAGMQ